MKSMTGFSVETLTKDKIEYKCILKSLNSRFLEVSIKHPAELKENEGWVREKINSKFSRGKIEIELISSNKQTENLSLDKSFIKLIKKSELDLKSKGVNVGPSSLAQLIKIQDFSSRQISESPSGLKDLVSKAIFNLKVTRDKEGKNIKKDLVKLIGEMEKIIKRVKKLEKVNSKQIFKKFKQYRKELNAEGKEINFSEVFSNINKSDINEEVVRFVSHLDLVKELIHLKQPIGKKLDFYTQELLREANTMSSKALIADIKNESVELKSYIERVKEHAQNVE